MKTYKSRRDIFKDFALAVKFRLEHDIPRDRYDAFFEKLRSQDGWRIEEFSREVEHINNRYPISTGLFIEIPITNESGKRIGVNSVLLEHETGPEFFLPLLWTAAGAAGMWAMNKIKDRALDAVIDRTIGALTDAMRHRWDIPIRHVELRSLAKGVMRVKYEDFNPSQLTCLVRRFPEIENIADVNDDCFGGCLFDADTQFCDDRI